MIEKKIDSKVMFNGSVIDVVVDKVKCHNGNTSKREVVRHNGGVAILVIVDDKVLIEKQFRYAVNEVVYEIPAGKLENFEDPFDAISRELEEETGYKANTIIELGFIYPTFGYSDEKIHLYYTNDLSKGELNLDEDENIELEFIEMDKFEEMIKNNIITDAKTIAAYLRYLLLKKL